MSYNQPAAFLSELIYDRSRVNATTVGSIFIDSKGTAWKLEKFLEGKNSDGTPNGYQGAVFTNADTPNGQVTIVSQGTEPASYLDWINDFQMGGGQAPSQFQSAQDLYLFAYNLNEWKRDLGHFGLAPIRFWWQRSQPGISQ